MTDTIAPLKRALKKISSNAAKIPIVHAKNITRATTTRRLILFNSLYYDLKICLSALSF